MGPELRGHAIIDRGIEAAKRLKSVFREQPLSAEEETKALEVFEDAKTRAVFAYTRESYSKSAWEIYCKDKLSAKEPQFSSSEEVEQKFTTLFGNGFVDLIGQPEFSGDLAEYRTTNLGERHYKGYLKSQAKT